jgi:predicted  nucleic acid-binding Zn-ribbon protein
MNKTEDISKLDRSIKDAEIRMKTVLNNVEALTKEIDLLTNQEKSLEENIKCLKKKRIIAIAQEFKKTKDELRRIHSRILILSNDKEHFIKTSKDMQDFINKTQKELEKLQNTSDNNVLQFNRGK